MNKGEGIYISIYFTLLSKLNLYTLIFTPSPAFVRRFQSKNITFKFILSLDWFFFFVSVVQRSFHFSEGKEPYQWAMEKIHACWRGYKCELKVTLFDGRSHEETISKRPGHIPLET